jgi:hypothetical protein
MTRKKFVKQLMAMDYSRNEAEAQAYTCTRMGASYEQALEWVKIGYRSRSYLDKLGAHLAKAVQPAVKTAEEIVKKFTDAVSAIDWEAVGERVAELAATADNAAAVHHADVLDALSYTALIAGRGNGRSDMALTERDFVEITPTAPPAEFSTRYMGRWEISAEGGGGNE